MDTQPTDTRSQPAGAELFEQAIENILIPPRPTVLDQIAIEAAREEPLLGEIANIISRDVLLSAGMIKMANSPFFGLRVRVKTAQQAVMMLGMELSVGVVTGMVLRQSFRPAPAMERFWDSSARIAQVSGWLAESIFDNVVDAGDAYTFGLFRDSGIAVLLQQFSHYQDTLREANQQATVKFTDVEQLYHPTTHTMVGCLMARTWWLPDTMTQAIRLHHDADELASKHHPIAEETRQLIAIAQLAEHIVQTIRQEAISCEWQKLGVFSMTMLGIDEQRVTELCELANALESQEN